MIKYYLILFFLITLSFISTAQEWAPEGAKWHYRKVSPPVISYNTFESIGDTLINGENSKILKGICSCTYPTDSIEIMYSDSNKVYWYNDSLDQFFLLYDFTADTGDFWTVVPPSPADSFRVTVDSISSILVNGNSLSVLHISSNSSWGFSGPIIERIGSSGCLLPQDEACDYQTGPLRCYEDSILGFYQHLNEVCDTSYSVGVTDLNRKTNMSVFPNPASDYLFLQM